jgi:DNA-binding response OmpR family regulator
MSKKWNPEVIPIAEVPLPNQMETCRPIVMVVDDEHLIADTLAAILSNRGFAPLVAYDGKSALEIARVIPPDLLISDVVMPGMSGIELAIALVRTMPDCKVLLFSGQASTIDLLAEECVRGHDFTALTKPIHPTDLLAHISECLETAEPDTKPTLLRA